MSESSGYDLATSLPKEMQNEYDFPKIKAGVTQSSRLNAWLWSSLLVTGHPEIEESLKQVFSGILKQQGLNTGAYQSYGIDQIKDSLKTYSDYIRNLYLGNNGEITLFGEDVEKIKTKKEDGTYLVTLPSVLKALSGEDLVFADAEWTKKFEFLASFNSYIGLVIENPKEKDFPFARYSLILGYPPRPVLNEYTVTEKQLCDWATNSDPAKQSDYLPYPYIPIACS